MADIRVTCPSCNTQLEIGAEFEGQQVECGNCLEVFTATVAKKAKSKTDDDDDKPASKSKSGSGGKSKSRAARKRDDDDDDYDHDRRRRDDDDDDDDYEPPRRRSGENGMAVASLVLGIVSILCMFGSCIPTVVACCCAPGTFGFSLGAIITGTIGMKKQEGKGMATAGLVMGVVSLIGIVLIFALAFAIGFGGALNNPNKFR